MSPVTTQTPQSFRGLVDVDGSPLPVALSFVAAAVVLTVGDDEIGRWSLGEIEFKATSDRRFEIHAEGDFLPFTPSDHDSFESFIANPEGESAEAAVDEGIATDLVLDGPPLDTGARSNGSPLLAEDAAEDEAPLPDFGLSGDSDPVDPVGLTDALGTSFQLPVAPESAINRSIEAATDEGEDLLGVSDPPDEYFAAGLHGPDGTVIPQAPTFRLAPVPSPVGSDPEPDPAPAAGASSLGRRMGDFLLGGEPASSQPRPDIHLSSPPAGVATAEPPAPPMTPPVEAEPTESNEVLPAREAPTAPETDDGADWEPSPRNRLGGFVDRIEPSNPQPEVEFTAPEPEAPPTVPSRPGGRLANAAEAIRNRVSDSGGDEADPSEQQRQWRLLAVAGTGFAVLLAGIIWGLAALLGGGDAPVADDSPTGSESPVAVEGPGAPDPAPVTTAAPTTSTSTSLTTTTTVAPNPVAVTGGDPEQFVSDWNSIAAGYSASLTVAGTQYPIEANLSQSVALTYGSDGLLTIAATPNGSASDQDILVVMGVVVAWAEPSLAPEQRKDVLASVGVDVTNPQLADMTGSSIRGDLEYRARVEGSTLYFSVGPVD